jgi:hypothetical protein
LAGLLAPWLFLILVKRFAFTRTVQVILGFLILFVAAFTLALPEIQDVSMAYKVGGAMFASIPPVLGLIDLVFWGIVERVFDIEQRQRLKRVVSTVWLGGAVVGFFTVSLSVLVVIVTVAVIGDDFPPAAPVYWSINGICWRSPERGLSYRSFHFVCCPNATSRLTVGKLGSLRLAPQLQFSYCYGSATCCFWER